MNPSDLVSITVPADGYDPATLLDDAGDEPRGFFADDGAVTAWRGAALLRTATDLPSLPREALPPDTRAYVVARFSADPRDDRDPAWEGTPAALWVLPRCAVTARDGRVTAQWVLPRGAAVPALPRSASRAGDATARALPADPSPWTALVTDALGAMRGDAMQKLVAARRVSLWRAGGWTPSSVLAAMRAHAAPGTVRFAVGYGDALFVGATPETLVAREGRALRTEALAGSLPRDPARDDLDRAALLASDKDRREHALVAEMIRGAIAPWCASIEAPEAPSVRSLRAIHHLWTPFSATLRDHAPDALAMAAALHPTPAVAGLPVGAASAWLRAHEPDPRGWYAGPVGWCDARGDGRFVVGIRSAVLRGERAWVYAGAGLVPGSDPAREWEETSVKMGLMRAVLGA